jgi:hypothetical protein
MEGLVKDRIKFKVCGLMVATAVMATLFAPFWVVTCVVIWAAIVIAALNPLSSQWRSWELAATVAWLLGAILAFSDVIVDGLAFMFFLVVGVVLSTSWALREANRESKPASLIEWATMLFVPTSMLLVVALAVTDLDLRLRLAVSESALRADVRRIDLGHKEILTREERRSACSGLVMSKRAKVASSGRREDSS